MRIKTQLSIIVLVAVLCVPLVMATGPTEAKGGFRTVTKTFLAPGSIGISSFGSAAHFPSTLHVEGFKNARIVDVNLALGGFGHEAPIDVDVMLVGPTKRNSRNALVMSDIGGNAPVSGLVVTLDDEANKTLSADKRLKDGRFRPKNVNDRNGLDDFDHFDTHFAPIPTGNARLSVFDGLDPNGDWQLYIHDDTIGGSGNVSMGWKIMITAKVKT